MGEKTKTLYKRKQRHRAKKRLVNKKSVSKHMLKTGRTGNVHSKRTHSTAHFVFTINLENVPTWWWQKIPTP